MTWTPILIICAGLGFADCRSYVWPENVPSMQACMRLQVFAPHILKDGERLVKIRCRPHSETAG